MRIVVDKVLVKYLQEAGYDIDYKKLTDIYKESRKDPEIVARRERELRMAPTFEDLKKAHANFRKLTESKVEKAGKKNETKVNVAEEIKKKEKGRYYTKYRF